METSKGTTETLREFIETAERSRKYPQSSATAFKVALNLFAGHLNQEELSSVETFSKNLEQIYGAVFNANKTKYSSGSLATYRARVMKVLADYNRFGKEPQKFTSWEPKLRKFATRSRKSSSDAESTLVGSQTGSVGVIPLQPGDNSVDRLELSLSDGRRAFIIVPRGLNPEDTEKIRGGVNFLLGGQDEGQSKVS